ncbi:unnamed protein product, partial [Didymodactylos carnosus]
ILAILMCGGSYCPLNPQDPQKRLLTLIDDTQTKHVLIHNLTKKTFINFTKYVINIEEIVLNIQPAYIVDDAFTELSTVLVGRESIAFVLFTSGSTGQPKAVQIRHRNSISCIQSYLNVGLFHKDNEVILQLTQCSFDAHFEEIIGTFITGSLLILMKSNGYLDMAYTCKLIHCEHITYVLAVPSFIVTMCGYLLKCQSNQYLESVRCFVSTGKY